MSREWGERREGMSTALNPELKSASDRHDLLQELKEVLRSLKRDMGVEESQKERALKILADFECWAVYVPLLESLMEKATEEERREYTQSLVRVYFNFQENPTKASDFLAAAASELKMPFNLFWRYNISEVMVHKDYKLEAEIIENIVSSYNDPQFIEKAFERLLLLYEEKLYQEQKVLEVYKRLLEVNASNQKALKFFKNYYMQKYQWDEVGHCLRALVVACEGTIEEHHYRIELATVYLHYLDETEKALDVLAAVDVSAGFEACKVKFSLLFLVGEFQKALEALQPLLAMAESRRMKATVHYHVAVTYQNLGYVDKALENYETSLKKDFTMFILKKYAKLAIAYNKDKRILAVMRFMEKRLETSDMSPENKTEIQKEAKRIYTKFVSAQKSH